MALKSKSAKAEVFIDWITEDILPKLRSQGLYVTQNNDETLVQYEAREAYLLKVNREWQQIVEYLYSRQYSNVNVLIRVC